MLFIYRMKVWLRHYLYRLFKGPTPIWASDAWTAIGKLNFLSLIPTILEIGLAPEHFFSRINLIAVKRVSGVKSLLHKSPIDFASNVITLVLAATWISKRIPSLHLTKRLLLLMLLSFPLLMQAVSIALILLTIILICAGSVPLLDNIIKMMFTERFRRSAEFQFGAMLVFLWVPLSPSIYKNLNWNQMRWSFFYLYGYFISVPMLVLLPLGAFTLPIVKTSLSALSKHPWQVLGLFFSAPGMGPIIFFIPLYFLMRLAMFPYAQALLMNQKRPIGLARDLEMRRFSLADIHLFEKLRLYEKLGSKRRWEAWLRGGSENSLLKEMERYKDVWKTFNGTWLRYTARYHLTVDEASKEYELLTLKCAHFRGFGTTLVSEPIANSHIAQLQSAQQPTLRRNWFRKKNVSA